MSTFTKILIIRRSSIGDLILISPILRTLRVQTGAEIHLMVRGNLMFVYEACPYVRMQWAYEEPVHRIIHKIKNEKYDFILDLQNNLRTTWICLRSGIAFARLNKINFRKALTVITKNKKFLPKQHIVDRMFEAARPLHITNDNRGLDYFVPERFQKSVLEYGLRSPYVALVSGGSYVTKQIPVFLLEKIIQKYPNKYFVLLGDTDDDNRVKILEKYPNVTNLCGRLHFHESAWIIKNSESVISSDTGLMHAAAAFRKKIFSIWGNTIPEFGMYPYGLSEGSIILEVAGLSCRPCSKLGYSSCPRGHFRCMREQDAEKVMI